LRLRWGTGIAIIVALSAPWFIYMWRRFDHAFITGYFLNENLWLFSGSLYGSQRSVLFYPKVMLVGLLPWTPLLHRPPRRRIPRLASVYARAAPLVMGDSRHRVLHRRWVQARSLRLPRRAGSVPPVRESVA
jgi:hypothetical protein